MKTKNYCLCLQPWHFILLLAVFYMVTCLVSGMKSEKMPEAKAESSFSSFDGEFIEEGYCFIFFYNEESELCNKMRYSVEQFAAKSDENFHFFEVNVNANPKYYREFNVSGIPNLLIFKEKKELIRIMGLVPESNLEKARKKLKNL